KNRGIEWLVAEYRNESQRMVGKGMNIRWDHFVNQYDMSRYVSSADGKDNRHIQFMREFASVISVLQIDRLNLGYANLECRTRQADRGDPSPEADDIIQVWCAEFDRVDDGGVRRDLLPVRDVASKRRGDKRMKEKVCFIFFCCVVSKD
ncbi:hypothetical protein K443DRAFT_684056, partial [Laccaria amethystina LaAM-08-1]